MTAPGGEMRQPRLREWLESQPVDFSGGWQASAAIPGVTVKMLADDMDEAGEVGARTKLVRFSPGAFATQTLLHRFWEESYLISGDLSLGCDDAGRGGELRAAPLYSCRPPGTPHGRMASPSGCLLLEIQYFVR